MKTILKAAVPLVLAALLQTGCGRNEPVAADTNSVTLPQINKALATWSLAHQGQMPDSLDVLTNMPALQGKQWPKGPAGKQLKIDPQTRLAVWAP